MRGLNKSTIFIISVSILGAVLALQALVYASSITNPKSKTELKQSSKTSATKYWYDSETDRKYTGKGYDSPEDLARARAEGFFRPYTPDASSEADEAFGDPKTIKLVKEARKSGKILSYWPQKNGPHRLLGIYDPETGVVEYLNPDYIADLFASEDVERVKDAVQTGKTIKVKTHINGALIASGPWEVESITDKGGKIVYSALGGE